jgi:hypothetical protein
MRFKKRVKIFPGFYLNFSNSGIGASAGVKGASVSFGKKGTYLNTSIPGTGLYNRQKIGGNTTQSNKESSQSNETQDSPVIISSIEGEIKSNVTDNLTSTNLAELRDTLLEAYTDKFELMAEYSKTEKELESAKSTHKLACIFIIGFIVKSFKNKVIELEEYLQDIKTQSAECIVNIDVMFDDKHLEIYNLLKSSFKKLSTSEFIWDVTASKKLDQKKERTSASESITREKVKFDLKNIGIVKSTYEAFYLQNINGDGDIYIYPAFVIYMDFINNKIELIDLKDLEIAFDLCDVKEPETAPSDAKVIGKGWIKENKDGSPDKRFAGNRELPKLEYGRLVFSSKSGLNESYMISNSALSEDFFDSFNKYKSSLL